MARAMRGAPGREEAEASGWLLLLDRVADGDTEITIVAPGQGRVVLISENILEDLRRRAENAELKAASTPLSPRELEVLSLAARGQTGVAIAEALGLAVNTVAQHLVSARRKLGVRTTREAVEVARTNNELS